MTFSEALESVKAGNILTRAGWNGADQWIRLFNGYNDKHFKIVEQPNSIGTIAPFIVIKTTQQALMPWFASQTDMLATDWEEVF